MGLEEARDILFWCKCLLGSELSTNYDYEKLRLYESLEFAIDMMDAEISYYCNLPKGRKGRKEY